MMLLIGIVIFLLFILFVLLLSPFYIEVDTRIPEVSFHWQNIGGASIWYDEEWRLSMQLFFYSKTMSIQQLKNKHGKKKPRVQKKKRINEGSRFRKIQKMVRVLKTFRVTEWKLALDTGDYTRNAQLYPLNFIPYAAEHVHINFTGD
ncbi:MAG TPA: hypothetical protein VK173_06055, partial [Lacibacter sp.]|nr:hypothetical protein [Lacibacter sp.]